MIIEFLTFAVDPDDQADWLAVDERIWTQFLSLQPGFVRKQIWVSRERPYEINAIIQWADEHSWKSIPTHTLAALDAAMGEWWRASTLQTFDVVGRADRRMTGH